MGMSFKISLPTSGLTTCEPVPLSGGTKLIEKMALVAGVYWGRITKALGVESKKLES